MKPGPVVHEPGAQQYQTPLSGGPPDRSMADVAAASETLAAQMKVALAVEQGSDSSSHAGHSSQARQPANSVSDLTESASLRQGQHLQ